MNELYHVGILVPDLDSAVDHYENLYGVKFRPPINVTSCRVVQRSCPDAPLTCRLTYSTQGPMYVELLEAQGDGLWSLRNIGGIHHIGRWSADPVCESKRLLAAGATWEATMYLDAETVGIVFVRYQGVLMELVIDALRAPLLEWMEGRAEHVM